MSESTESTAPSTETADPARAALEATAPAPAAPAAEKPATPDLDARLAQIEQALKAKTAPAPKAEEPKTAAEVTNSDLMGFGPAADLLKQGKRAEAVLAFLADQADDDILLELAPLLEGKTRKVLTVEEQVKATLAAEKAAEKKRLEDEAKKQEEVEVQEAQAQLQSYLVRGATAQKAGIEAGKYPFIEDYGVDPARFQELLFKHVDEQKAIPEPDVILALIEEEHAARWRKSRFARKDEAPIDPDERIRRSFEEHAAKAPPPVYQASGQDDEDPARAILAKMDHENRTRLGWR